MKIVITYFVYWYASWLCFVTNVNALFTYDCVSYHESTQILKFADYYQL